jgi:capsular polysaccharide transport system permease protein
MNERSREDTLRLAENEVLVAQNRLADTQRALKNFRDTHRDIDLKSTITGLQGVVMGLEEERAKTSAQLAETASYMNADAPVRRALEARLAALDKQIASQRARLSDSKSDGNLNAQVSEYERLTLDHSFAQKQMTSALGALENARISLLSKTRYLVAIESPTLPDESLYPRVLQFTAVFGLVLLLAYGLVTLVVASVREHMGF